MSKLSMSPIGASSGSRYGYKGTIEQEKAMEKIGSSNTGNNIVNNGISYISNLINMRFNQPKVSKKNEFETDSITRKEENNIKTSTLSFFCGFESSPMTIQMKYPEGEGMVSFLFSLFIVMTNYYIYGGKATSVSMLWNVFCNYSFGFIAGVCYRVQLNSLPKNGSSLYCLFVKYARLIAIIISLRGGVTSTVIGFLAGRQISIKPFSAVLNKRTDTPSTPVAKGHTYRFLETVNDCHSSDDNENRSDSTTNGKLSNGLIYGNRMSKSRQHFGLNQKSLID
jgi:hypothetical protein